MIIYQICSCNLWVGIWISILRNVENKIVTKPQHLELSLKWPNEKIKFKEKEKEYLDIVMQGFCINFFMICLWTNFLI